VPAIDPGGDVQWWPGYSWPVFPCLPEEKIPATAHGFRDATTDEQHITG
jgi:Bifunctional DNA primase/polymerase, N-terminal